MPPLERGQEKGISSDMDIIVSNCTSKSADALTGAKRPSSTTNPSVYPCDHGHIHLWPEALEQCRRGRTDAQEWALRARRGRAGDYFLPFSVTPGQRFV